MIKNICVVGGLGKMGGFHVKRLEQEHPELNIYVQDIFQDPVEADAYIIATPPDTHYEIAKDLLLRGKHVLIEKPMALRSDHCVELCRLAVANKCALLVGHTQRYNPVFVDNTELLRNSDTLIFDLHLPYRYDIKDIVFDLMVHQLELALFLTGQTYLEATSIRQVNGSEVKAVLLFGDIVCLFNVSYGADKDIRTITNKDLTVDLLSYEGEHDNLYYLHKRFLDLCSVGEIPYDTMYAVNAVEIAEHIQRSLFSGT